MFPPDQMRIWAADLQAYAARCERPDDMEECLLLAARYLDLAARTEAFMRVLSKGGAAKPWPSD